MQISPLGYYGSMDEVGWLFLYFFSDGLWLHAVNVNRITSSGGPLPDGIYKSMRPRSDPIETRLYIFFMYSVRQFTFGNAFTWRMIDTVRTFQLTSILSPRHRMHAAPLGLCYLSRATTAW